MAILVHHFLFPHDLSQQVRVLDVVGKRIHHGIMVIVVVNVEVVAAAAYHLSPCLYPRLLSLVWTRTLKILLVLAHLHHLAIPLHLCHFVGSKRYLFVYLLMLEFLFFVLSILQHFFIELSI